MKVELYVGLRQVAKCKFCGTVHGTRMQVTERCEYYCSVRCAEEDYIFTFDELVVVSTAGMVPVLIRRSVDG